MRQKPPQENAKRLRRAQFYIALTSATMPEYAPCLPRRKKNSAGSMY